MRRLILIAVVAVVTLAGLVFAQAFKDYPGAKLDKAATDKANEALREMKGQSASIYTSADSFEKVCAFYKALGKEYKMPGSEGEAPAKLPSGQKLKEAYYIFDRAESIATSKQWIKVQRPYIGNIKMEGFKPVYEDVRDVTAIILSQTK